MASGLLSNSKWGVLLIASLAFGLYVICPRMSAMMVQQAKMKGLSVNTMIVLGALISIPLFVILAQILVRFGMGDSLRSCRRLRGSSPPGNDRP